MQKQKPLFVLSPCGISLLLNQVKGEDKELVLDYANSEKIEQIPKPQGKQRKITITD